MLFSLENRNYKISPCRGRAEKIEKRRHYFQNPQKQEGFRLNTETQKSHRQERAIVRPCLFKVDSQRVSKDSIFCV